MAGWAVVVTAAVDSAAVDSAAAVSIHLVVLAARAAMAGAAAGWAGVADWGWAAAAGSMAEKIGKRHNCSSSSLAADKIWHCW